MILNYTSIESMFAKIGRDTGLTRGDLEGDMAEWIAEALSETGVQLPASPDHTLLKVQFHAAPIPCGCVQFLAVSWNGFRLPWRSRDNDPRAPVRTIKPDSTAQNVNSVFYTDPQNVEYNPITNKIRQWPYPSISKMPFHKDMYYQVKGGHIWTSFPEGEITLHYEKIPVDANDMPLVPDNMALREAIYYFVRQKLVAAGLFKDPAFTIQQLLTMYENYAARAIEQITYPSPDEVQGMYNTWVRLVSASNYFENFSDPSGPEPFYDTYGIQQSLWRET